MLEVAVGDAGLGELIGELGEASRQRPDRRSVVEVVFDPSGQARARHPLHLEHRKPGATDEHALEDVLETHFPRVAYGR